MRSPARQIRQHECLPFFQVKHAGNCNANTANFIIAHTTSLLPELIALGIDVIHPLQPLPATDLPAVKQEFGAQLAFLGGIDISEAMTGTTEDVLNEVKLRIGQLAPGGGYILAPSNHLQADVPAENVVTLFQSAHEFGIYPLQ